MSTVNAIANWIRHRIFISQLFVYYVIRNIVFCQLDKATNSNLSNSASNKLSARKSQTSYRRRCHRYTWPISNEYGLLLLRCFVLLNFRRQCADDETSQRCWHWKLAAKSQSSSHASFKRTCRHIREGLDIRHLWLVLYGFRVCVCVYRQNYIYF